MFFKVFQNTPHQSKSSMKKNLSFETNHNSDRKFLHNLVPKSLYSQKKYFLPKGFISLKFSTLTNLWGTL